MAQASGRTPVEQDHRLPVLVFLHGGGLVSLSRDAWPPQWLFDDALDAGFILISADYRLLCPSTGHDILEDIVDLFKWIESDLNTRLSAMSSQLADLDRIVVAGGSAGGYLASLACLYAKPRPKAHCSLYPLSGDFLLDHWVTPKTEPYYQGQPLLTDASVFQPIYDSTKPVTTSKTDGSDDPRSDFDVWLIQNATLLDVITGHKGLGAKLKQLPYDKRAEAIPEDARVLFPQLAIAESKDFPPTILLYAAKDSLVPTEGAVNFEKALKSNGAELDVVVFGGRDHCFDLEDDVTEEERKRLGQVVPFLLKQSKK